MTEKNIQIESRDLNLWYGDAQALKSVSMDMPGNKVTAVVITIAVFGYEVVRQI